MPSRRWSIRTTRRHIIELLRRAPLTIGSLAERLELTASAVRVHVVELEREGLVRRAGLARGLNRPAAIYELAPGLDALLCTAYVPFVASLLQTMGEELPAPRVAELMQLAGRRLAANFGRPSGTLPQRAQAASEFLNKLGALTEVDTAAGHLAIRGHDCPLASAVEGRPEVCQAMERFVAEVVRAPVHECCDRHGRPRCCFAIGTRISPPRAARPS